MRNFSSSIIANVATIFLFASPATSADYRSMFDYYKLASTTLEHSEAIFEMEAQHSDDDGQARTSHLRILKPSGYSCNDQAILHVWSDSLMSTDTTIISANTAESRYQFRNGALVSDYTKNWRPFEREGIVGALDALGCGANKSVEFLHYFQGFEYPLLRSQVDSSGLVEWFAMDGDPALPTSLSIANARRSFEIPVDDDYMLLDLYAEEKGYSLGVAKSEPTEAGVQVDVFVGSDLHRAGVESGSEIHAIRLNVGRNWFVGFLANEILRLNTTPFLGEIYEVEYRRDGVSDIVTTRFRATAWASEHPDPRFRPVVRISAFDVKIADECKETKVVNLVSFFTLQERVQFVTADKCQMIVFMDQIEGDWDLIPESLPSGYVAKIVYCERDELDVLAPLCPEI
jgi:hypothetical protein